jgi:hypothetical protein
MYDLCVVQVPGDELVMPLHGSGPRPGAAQ